MAIYAINDNTRIMIRPSKVLYFNRVAKTGSNAMTGLIVEYFQDHVIRYNKGQNELLFLPVIDLKKEFKEMMKVTKPAAFTVHISFIDITQFGSPWVPTWFSMVRDPIERVGT